MFSHNCPLSISLRLALLMKLRYTTNHVSFRCDMYLRAKGKYFHHVFQMHTELKCVYPDSQQPEWQRALCRLSACETVWVQSAWALSDKMISLCIGIANCVLIIIHFCVVVRWRSDTLYEARHVKAKGTMLESVWETVKLFYRFRIIYEGGIPCHCISLSSFVSREATVN
jgi:hypothetical protein